MPIEITEKSKPDKNNRFRLNPLFVTVIIILCLCFAMLSCFFIANNVFEENNEKDIRLEAAMMNNVICNKFLRPLTVSESMAKDPNLIENIMSNKGADDAEAEANIEKYLKSIKDGFGYNMAFAISDNTNVYYTYKGISRIIDPYSENDSWYQAIKNSDRGIDLDVDNDEAADWALSVFINVAMRDANNNFIGTCGVGVNMEQLYQLLEKYERIYDVDISLIDENGLIQIDTESAKIERDYIKIDDLEDMADGEYYYEILDNGSRVITYLEDFEWYLVVTNSEEAIPNIIKYARPIVVIFGIGIIIILGTYFAGNYRKKKKQA